MSKKSKPLNERGLVGAVVSGVLVKAQSRGVFRARQEHHLVAVLLHGDGFGIVKALARITVAAVVCRSHDILDKSSISLTIIW